MTSPPLVWIDCEMTGLDLDDDALIEVAALVTDSELNVLGDGVDVVIRPPARGARDDARRRAARCTPPPACSTELDAGVTLAEAEAQVLAYVTRVRPGARQGAARAATRSAPTAASSPATCRGSRLTCTTGSSTSRSIKELARRWYPRVYFNSPAKNGGHRALADIRESHRGAAVLPGGGLRAASPARTPTRPAAIARHAGDRPARRSGTPTADSAAEAAQDSGSLTAAASSRTLSRRRSRRARRHGGCSSAGRAPGCGPGGRGFKSRHSPHAGNPPLTWPSAKAPRGSGFSGPAFLSGPNETITSWAPS